MSESINPTTELQLPADPFDAIEQLDDQIAADHPDLDGHALLQAQVVALEAKLTELGSQFVATGSDLLAEAIEYGKQRLDAKQALINDRFESEG